jgi:hypothetical protein
MIAMGLSSLAGSVRFRHKRETLLNGVIRQLCQHFSGWQRPVQRNRITIRRRTDHTQWAVVSGTANHLDFPAGYNLRASKAIAFVVKGSPFPESIKLPQNLQLVLVGKLAWGNGWHSHRITESNDQPQSVRWQIHG